jgi:probable HAF family extracellular repeat protein
MQPKIVLSFLVVALNAGAWVTPAIGQAPATEKPHLRYKLVDLGTFGGPHSRVPYAQRGLNSAGAVVGLADTDIPDPFAPNCANSGCVVQQGFIWRDGVRTRLLGFFPNFESGAQGINEAGVVVGESQNGLIDPASGAPTTHAVLWNKTGFLDLGTLGGNSSSALGVNNRRQIVGTAQTTIPDPTSGSTESHAFLWENGVMHDLGTLGGPFALAADINERGEVGGVSVTAADPITGQQEFHGFVWKDGRMISLTLGGTFGEGTTLNNLGQAVGHYTLQRRTRRPCRSLEW